MQIARLRTLLLLALLMIVGASCAADGHAWKRGDNTPPAPVVAGTTAVYSLYKKGDKDRPVWSGVLATGDRYGFRKTGDGDVVAFTDAYGDIRLVDRKAKSYVWRPAADDEGE